MTTQPVTTEGAQDSPLELQRVDHPDELPPWASYDELALTLHEKMAPYNDTLPDVKRGLDYALSDEPGKGGYVILAGRGGKLVGALVMLETGMKGYVPENLLLMVVVDASQRGQGVGGKIIERALSEAEGAVKLHVEHDNPARRLYERMGFTNKYLEMRYEPGR